MKTSLLVTFIIIYIIEAFLGPYLLYKKSQYKPYFMISIPLATILFILFILARITHTWKLLFIAEFAFIIIPIGVVVLLNVLNDYGGLKGLVKKNTAPKTYLKRYDHQAVFYRASAVETEYWGYLRFGMKGVSYFAYKNAAAKTGSICTYKKALADEKELYALTQEFCDQYGPFCASEDEWQLANALWHDEKGAFRILLIFVYDDQYGPGRRTNEYAKIVDYAYLSGLNYVKDNDPENDHGFRIAVKAGGPRKI